MSTDRRHRFDWDYVAEEARRRTGVIPLRGGRFVRGAGAQLWDVEGRRYIDCAAGSGVALLGHCHPRVVEAIRHQVGELVTLPASYPHPLRAVFFERLFATAPKGLDRVFLQSTGAESIEGAIKFARLSTGRSGVVACEKGFHGRTMGALAATWKDAYKKPFLPLAPGYGHVPYGDVEALEQAVGDDTAAVIIEPIQGEGGVRPAPAGYLQAARAICDRHGALLVFDEVQTGMGRTGRWWACQHEDVSPDLLCSSKALGGGVPLAAVLVGEKVQGFFLGAHGSTFSGNLLAVAAGEAVLRTIEEDGLLDRAMRLGALFQETVAALPEAARARIHGIRGRGCMWGVVVDQSRPLVTALLDEGVVAIPAGPDVVRFLFPAVIEEEDLVTAVQALGRVLIAAE